MRLGAGRLAENQRIEEPRREHCTHRQPSHSRSADGSSLSDCSELWQPPVRVVAAYYLLPLDKLTGIWLGVALAVGLLALTAVVAYQVRAIIRHPHSAVRAVEALAITVPVFLLLFAGTYFMMEQANPDNFNVDSLTR